jgi:hypothetical protein
MKIDSVLKEQYFSRSNLINYLIGLYGYKSYLEIGVDSGENFENVDCHYKVGIDPTSNYSKVTFSMTSDEFFKINKDKFDIVFIDGLHISDQVILDIDNSLKILNPRGTIVLHDCLPHCEGAQDISKSQDHWNGDVWKAFAHYRAFSNLTMFTMISDQGLGIIKYGKQEAYVLPNVLDFKYLLANYKNLMLVFNNEKGLKLLRNIYNRGL